MKCGDFLTCKKNHPSMTIHVLRKYDERKTIVFCVFYGNQIIFIFIVHTLCNFPCPWIIFWWFWEPRNTEPASKMVTEWFARLTCWKKSWTWRMLWIWTLNSHWKHLFFNSNPWTTWVSSQLIAKMPFPLTKVDIWVDFSLLYVFIIQCDSWAVIIILTLR
jgi:hypothetical protein